MQMFKRERDGEILLKILFKISMTISRNLHVISVTIIIIGL